MKIATAAYPMDPLPDWAAYEAKLSDWVARAAEADLLVFPEYGSLELAMLDGPDVAGDLDGCLRAVARRLDDVDALHAKLAAQYDVYILGASVPAGLEGRPTNQARFYGPQGLIGVQDKLIMTRYERDPWDIAPGDTLNLFDTPLGKIGIAICYDSEFPLIGRALVDAGAEIILCPSCTEAMAGYSRVRIGAMARALEGQCITVHSPTVGPAPWCPPVDQNTGAAAIYGPPDRGFPGTGVIAQGELNAPGWVMADVDLEAVREVRRDGGVLNMTHWAEQDARLASVNIVSA